MIIKNLDRENFRNADGINPFVSNFDPKKLKKSFLRDIENYKKKKNSDEKVGQAKTRAKLAKLFKEHNVWKGDECSFDQSMENPEDHGWKDKRAVRWFVEDALAIYSTL